MKTITVDWDTYHKELQDKYEKGLEMGIWKAARYLENPGENPIEDKFKWEAEYLVKQSDKRQASFEHLQTMRAAHLIALQTQ